VALKQHEFVVIASIMGFNISQVRFFANIGRGLARLSKNCQGLICRPMLKRDRR
jgi:hypothetical protein